MAVDFKINDKAAHSEAPPHKHWNVPVSELTTGPNVVIHAQSGWRLSYGEIAAFAEVPAQAPDVTEDELKTRVTFRLISKDVMRVEPPGKVNGTAPYAISVQVPGMLYGTPIEGASPDRIDDSKAEAIGGLVRIVAPDSLPLDDIRLRRVLDYISANIENNISLVDLAGVAAYSPFHFARKFNLAMGIPPHRYLSRVRLEKAMAELAAGKLPIAVIALNAHFSSQASFTRAFHRATGMTPKQYRCRRL